jgi:hypothetical protein
MYSSLPSARARARTGSWGASGLLLTTRAARHAGSEARRAAAADEVGDPPGGAREAGRPLALQKGPDALADRLLDPGHRLQAGSRRSGHGSSPRGAPIKRSMSYLGRPSRVASVTRTTRMPGRRLRASVN